MQVCSCQLPMYCLMLLWRRLQCRLAWWQHSNLPADFVWVVATSFLFKLWIYSVLSEHWIATSELIVCRFFEGSIKTHISPFHTSTARPWGYNEHNQNIIINLLLQLTYFYDFDLVSDLLWPFVPHDLQTLCFSVENIVLQWTQSKDNYKSLFFIN